MRAWPQQAPGFVEGNPPVADQVAPESPFCYLKMQLEKVLEQF